MIFTFIIGVALIFYYVVNALDIDMFIKKFHGAGLAPTIDSFVIVGSLLWFIVQSFLYSGPIVIIVLCTVIFTQTYSVSQRKLRWRTSFMLFIIILLISFIILNEIYIKFNIWQFIFAI